MYTDLRRPRPRIRLGRRRFRFFRLRLLSYEPVNSFLFIVARVRRRRRRYGQDTPEVEIVPAFGTPPYCGCGLVGRFYSRRKADSVHEPSKQKAWGFKSSPRRLSEEAATCWWSYKTHPHNQSRDMDGSLSTRCSAHSLLTPPVLLGCVTHPDWTTGVEQVVSFAK